MKSKVMRDLKGEPGTHNDDCDDDDDDDDDEKEGDEILPPIRIKRECQQDHEDGVDLSDSTIDKNNEELSKADDALFKLLNLDPHNDFDAKEKFKYKEEAVLVLTQFFPSAFRKMYTFHGYFDDPELKTYPLTAACALGASISTIRKIFELYPKASFDALCESCVSKFSMDIVEFLVESRPEALEEHDDLHANVFHHAARSGDPPFEILQYLVEKRHRQLLETDVNKCTPLHFACENGLPLSTFRLFVDNKGIVLKKKNSDGQTPLHNACSVIDTSLDVIEFMVKNCHTALEIPDEFGNVPLHAAVRSMSARVVHFLIASNKNMLTSKANLMEWTPLHMACAERDRSSIVQIVAKGNPSILIDPDANGRTPLHLASAMSDVETVKILVGLNQGALEMRTKDKYTPFVEACMAENVPVIKYLADKYPDVLQIQIENDHWSPLHVVCANGKKKAPQILLEIHPLLAKLLDKKSRTPLALFASNCSGDDEENMEVIQALLHVYPDARKMVDDDGNPPLNQSQTEALIDGFLTSDRRRSVKKPRTSS